MRKTNEIHLEQNNPLGPKEKNTSSLVLKGIFNKIIIKDTSIGELSEEELRLLMKIFYEMSASDINNLTINKRNMMTLKSDISKIGNSISDAFYQALAIIRDPNRQKLGHIFEKLDH